jgi:hypothetical protein
VFTRQKLVNLVTLVRHYKNESIFFDSTNVLEHVSCLSWTVPTFDEAAPPSIENITVALCLRDHRYRHLDKKKIVKIPPPCAGVRRSSRRQTIADRRLELFFLHGKRRWVCVGRRLLGARTPPAVT